LQEENCKEYLEKFNITTLERYGNWEYSSWINRTGDTEFYLRFTEKGIKHITSNDSIIYHFNEGERNFKKE